MAHKYAEITFTEKVKQLQYENNSREGYAGMEQGEDFNFLMSQREADFIAARDSFYMASVGETGWPYVQHRGGPQGFMRLIDKKTIGFADYSGNRQYISTGNFSHDDRVSLFFMDYPNRTRLKILGRVEIISPDDVTAMASLEDPNFRAPIERGFIIHIQAFDWNCPKYITPRYDSNEIEQLTRPLTQENNDLKAQLSRLNSTENSQSKLGDGPLKLIISGIRQITPKIKAYELSDVNGAQLPLVTAGSHIEFPLMLDNGRLERRHYSICSNPQRKDIYEIAVLKQDHGEGGSQAIHQQYQLGQEIGVQLSANHFELQLSRHAQAAPAVLIAGGIGITPIKAMAHVLKNANLDFTLHYAGRSEKDMAFSKDLSHEFGPELTLYRDDLGQQLQIAKLLENAASDSLFYVCGPAGLINAILSEAEKLDIDLQRIHFERFSPAIAAKIAAVKPTAVRLTLARSNKIIEVGANESLLDAMLAAQVPAAYSCKLGDCKSCAVKVLDGDPLHLDSALSEIEKVQHRLICPCVSRATSAHLTLDI